MEKTPQSLRKHVCIYGETNAGKSTLFNKILGTDTSIVSEVKGTTTDVHSKSMELIPYGPIVLMDTAGLNDGSVLGEKRMERTMAAISRTDIAIYCIDFKKYSHKEYENITKIFKERNIPCITVITKVDLLNDDEILKAKKIKAILINGDSNLLQLKNAIGKEMDREESDNFLLKDIVEPRESIILVIPIDSESPKGRLIAPQVRLIRECLDRNIVCITTTLETLDSTINNIKAKIIVTDSQVFNEVDKIVNGRMKITSFSILLAKQNGFLEESVQGTYAINFLKDGSKVLILESCTHTKNHEDIGSVKIPKLLKKITGQEIEFNFFNGRDFPKTMNYDLVIHCGGCMMTTREVKSRIEVCKKNNIPIINYGVFLAFANNMLDRSIEMIRGEHECGL
ncbi:MAG: [FeFe] hydrogenase H-cluster maturation GTPase HydF [Lachnospirales bacterium]